MAKESLTDGVSEVDEVMQAVQAAGDAGDLVTIAPQLEGYFAKLAEEKKKAELAGTTKGV